MGVRKDYPLGIRLLFACYFHPACLLHQFLTPCYFFPCQHGREKQCGDWFMLVGIIHNGTPLAFLFLFTVKEGTQSWGAFLQL